jgi:FixJ family two-component response regulator
MYTSHSTPTNGIHFPGTGQPAQPVVYIHTDDCSERETLEAALSNAGFRARPLTFAGAFLRLPAIVEPTCLVLERKMLPPFVALEQRVMPIICLTADGDVATTVRAMRAGAIDVLARPVGARMLIDAVRNALDVSAASLRQAVERRRLQERYADLSQRERQVMGLVATGLMNKQIAHELQISEITVKAHRGRMTRKMDARSLASLIQMANRLGLTAPSGQA